MWGAYWNAWNEMAERTLKMMKGNMEMMSAIGYFSMGQTKQWLDRFWKPYMISAANTMRVEMKRAPARSLEENVQVMYELNHANFTQMMRSLTTQMEGNKTSIGWNQFLYNEGGFLERMSTSILNTMQGKDGGWDEFWTEERKVYEEATVGLDNAIREAWKDTWTNRDGAFTELGTFGPYKLLRVEPIDWRDPEHPTVEQVTDKPIIAFPPFPLGAIITALHPERFSLANQMTYAGIPAYIMEPDLEKLGEMNLDATADAIAGASEFVSETHDQRVTMHGLCHGGSVVLQVLTSDPERYVPHVDRLAVVASPISGGEGPMQELMDTYPHLMHDLEYAISEKDGARVIDGSFMSFVYDLMYASNPDAIFLSKVENIRKNGLTDFGVLMSLWLQNQVDLPEKLVEAQLKLYEGLDDGKYNLEIKGKQPDLHNLKHFDVYVGLSLRDDTVNKELVEPIRPYLNEGDVYAAYIGKGHAAPFTTMTPKRLFPCELDGETVELPDVIGWHLQ